MATAKWFKMVNSEDRPGFVKWFKDDGGKHVVTVPTDVDPNELSEQEVQEYQSAALRK